MAEFDLVNRSKWATEDLRMLAGKVVDVTGSDGAVRIVNVVTGRGAGKPADKQFSGFCFPGSGSITVRVPNTKVNSSGEWAKFDVEGFAKMLTHEIHHLLGTEHREMIDWWELDCSYAKGMEVRSERMKRFHDVFGGRFDWRL